MNHREKCDTLHQLETLAETAKARNIADLFNQGDRASNFCVSAAGLFLDYSKQNINHHELALLNQQAQQVGLSEGIKAMFLGEKINNTENRAVLHTLLRAPAQVKQQVLGEQADEVAATELQMAKIVDDVCQGQMLSASGKTFSDVLVLGIGGSYYGIKVALTALSPFHCTGLKVHVLANVDGAAVQQKLDNLSAETTLVVVISKTFTTQETLLNASTVKCWMLDKCPQAQSIARQWIAVSTNIRAVTDFGIKQAHILPMWDWVGGRFSLWSAVGLPLALAIGNQHFAALKAGAYAMDQHFQQAAPEQNMPVIMALLGIWNRNFLACSSLAILPYDHSLRALPGYLQQLDMESNGKSVAKSGEKLSHATAPIVFGQEGTNGQHAFMQLMHQSDEVIPADFIVALQGASEHPEHHKVLVANCFGQSEALMQGKSLQQVVSELEQTALSADEIAALAPHKTMKGNNPSNTLLLPSTTPTSLGALLALYEHKIFVQGLVWQLNPFDQWGVELGKQLGKNILSAMEGQAQPGLSASSQALIAKFNHSERH